MNVASAWWSVEDEIIKLSPIGIGDELLKRIGCHATAPKGGCLWTDEETNAEQLDTIFLDRLDEVAAVNMNSLGTGILHIEHFGHAGAEDVGIEQTYLIAKACQGNGEVGRNGRLSYASLT